MHHSGLPLPGSADRDGTLFRSRLCARRRRSRLWDALWGAEDGPVEAGGQESPEESRQQPEASRTVPEPVTPSWSPSADWSFPGAKSSGIGRSHRLPWARNVEALPWARRSTRKVRGNALLKPPLRPIVRRQKRSHCKWKPMATRAAVPNHRAMSWWRTRLGWGAMQSL